MLSDYDGYSERKRMGLSVLHFPGPSYCHIIACCILPEKKNASIVTRECTFSATFHFLGLMLPLMESVKNDVHLEAIRCCNERSLNVLKVNDRKFRV